MALLTSSISHTVVGTHRAEMKMARITGMITKDTQFGGMTIGGLEILPFLMMRMVNTSKHLKSIRQTPVHMMLN